MPPKQTRETRASHRAGKLGEHVGRDTPTRECVHQPQADRHGGIHVPSAAPASRGEDQPGDNGPAENTDDGERDVQVGDVKGEAGSRSHRTIVTAMNRRTVVSANSSAARASGIRE